MTRLFKKLARSSDGTATIELALMLPIFASMLIGVVDITTAFNRKLEMEQAIQRAIERVMQTTTDYTVEENIKAEAAAAAGINVNDVIVTYTQTCDGVITDPATDCPTNADAVRYTNVKASTTFTPMFPLARVGLTQAQYTIEVETGIRTS